jgi:hypothetical protein
MTLEVKPKLKNCNAICAYNNDALINYCVLAFASMY